MQQSEISHQGESSPFCLQPFSGSIPSQQIIYSSVAISAIMAVVLVVRSLTQLVEACKGK